VVLIVVTTKKNILIQFVYKKSKFFKFMRISRNKNLKNQHTKTRGRALGEELLIYAGVFFRKQNS